MSLQCPVCNQALVTYKAASFEVDICRDGCSGIWFDANELEKSDQHDEQFPAELLRVRKNAAVVIDRSKTRVCPRCNPSALARVKLDAETNFEIDRCPQCLGHWLDIGELERIRERSKAEEALASRLQANAERIERELRGVNPRPGLQAIVRLIFK
jgi:Zn-finger nucleic acid-binding protein